MKVHNSYRKGICADIFDESMYSFSIELNTDKGASLSHLFLMCGCSVTEP